MPEYDGAERLVELLRDEYSRADTESRPAISPSHLADAVYKRIDRRKLAPTLVRIGCVLELRQLARQLCRERVPDLSPEEESMQGEFPFVLQPRYPCERDDERQYVLRNLLTYQERLENIRRLRACSRTLDRHADALQAETNDLVRRGLLFPDQPTKDGGESLSMQ